VLLAGLGGFVLGAATVLFVVWVYGRQQGGFVPPPAPPGTPAPAVRPAPAPGVPLAAPPSWNPPGPAPGAPAPAPGAPSPSPGAGAPSVADIELLRGRNLMLPVQGVRSEDLKDSFTDPRGSGRLHEAIDIMAPRNTPVVATEDGKVAKLFLSRQGGNTIYQFDPTDTYCYYYAHLDRYADNLREGAPIRRGQLLGFVGSTGNADASAPHLHFAVLRLTAEKHWWQGTPLDPFLILHGP
jgi:murein DD-endopeptidase MepM/ murein hydrolase activator NlpD